MSSSIGPVIRCKLSRIVVKVQLSSQQLIRPQTLSITVIIVAVKTPVIRIISKISITIKIKMTTMVILKIMRIISKMRKTCHSATMMTTMKMMLTVRIITITMVIMTIITTTIMIMEITKTVRVTRVAIALYHSLKT